MDKKVLVTGAAGFIGFHVANALAARGDSVVGYDNFNAYYSPKLKRGRAEELAKKDLKIIEGDISNQKLLLQIVREYKVTHLIHLAAQPGVRYSLIDPEAYIKTNIEGFTSILEVCRETKIPLIYASSSSVYGANAKIPFSVEDRTDAPVSLYGATKKSNEVMAYSYHHLFQFPVIGLRFFTVYGPWGRPDMAYFSFAEAIMKGSPLELYFPPPHLGVMRRDFTYIDDIVEGTIAALDLETSSCEIFNLGNHTPVEISQLVSYLENDLGKKANIVAKPMPAGDVPTTYADIELSRKRLGFEPKTTLEVGIRHFVDWYLKNSIRFS